MCSLSAKAFRNLLQGLVKRNYFGEQIYSNEALLESLFGVSSSEVGDRGDLVAEIESFETLLRAAGEGNWDDIKMEEIVTAQLARASPLFSAEQGQILIAFWSAEREKIHSALVKVSTWNRQFQDIAWRVDVKAVSKAHPELNEPVVFFELSTATGGGGKKSINDGSNSGGRTQKAKFEMNREEVGEMVKALDQIQRKIDENS